MYQKKRSVVTRKLRRHVLAESGADVNHLRIIWDMLVIDNSHPTALKNFIDFYNALDRETKGKISYMLIDAALKPSASKA